MPPPPSSSEVSIRHFNRKSRTLHRKLFGLLPSTGVYVCKVQGALAAVYLLMSLYKLSSVSTAPAAEFLFLQWSRVPLASSQLQESRLPLCAQTLNCASRIRDNGHWECPLTPGSIWHWFCLSREAGLGSSVCHRY